jgi:Carboxypeptidase regulatory-like domain
MASPASQPINISGTVVDRNGVPVPYARVAIWQNGQLVPLADNPGYTGENGTFIFTVSLAGRYQITADMPGYNGTVDMVFANSTSVVVALPSYRVSTITPAPSQGALAPDLPRFTVTRTGPYSVQVHLDSPGRATSIRGFYVKAPAIGQPELIPIGQPLSEDETMSITDRNLTGVVGFVAFSWVDGSYTEVVNTTV